MYSDYMSDCNSRMCVCVCIWSRQYERRSLDDCTKSIYWIPFLSWIQSPDDWSTGLARDTSRLTSCFHMRSCTTSSKNVSVSFAMRMLMWSACMFQRSDIAKCTYLVESHTNQIDCTEIPEIFRWNGFTSKKDHLDLFFVLHWHWGSACAFYRHLRVRVCVCVCACVWVSECEREEYLVLQTPWIRCTAHTIWRQNVFGMTLSFMPNKLTSHDSHMKESCHTVGSCSHEPQTDTATHCNATHCNPLQHTATHCTLHLRLIQPRATNHEPRTEWSDCRKLTHCKTLQNTATHCNTLHLRWIQPRTTNWIIKLPRLYEPLEGAPEQVMSHVCMIHVTHVNEWWHTCECVMSHVWMSAVTHVIWWFRTG